LRRAYAPVREATKFESGVAWKGIREGAYRAVGAGLVTAAATDLLSVTSFYGTFANFVARHAESLISYVTKVFQNPALIDIINWISKFGL